MYRATCRQRLHCSHLAAVFQFLTALLLLLPDSCEGIPVIAEVPRPAGDDEALLGALLPQVGGGDQGRHLEDIMNGTTEIGEHQEEEQSGRHPDTLHTDLRQCALISG